MQNRQETSVFDVKVVRIINGEIIISVVQENNDDVVLEHPYVIISSGNGLAIANWIPFCSDKSVTINRSHIIYIANPEDELSVQYKKATGRVIVPKVNSFKLVS